MHQNNQRKAVKAALPRVLLAISLPIISLFTPVTAVAQPTYTTQADPIAQMIHVSALSMSGRGSYRPHSELVKPWGQQLRRDSEYAATTIVLTKSGKVYTWGNNISGHVGNGTTCTLSDPGQYNKKPPCYYDQPQDITKYFGGDRVVKLTGKLGTVVAFTDSGKMYYWGHEWSPELEKYIHFNRPTKLDALSPYHVTDFSGSRDYYAPFLVNDNWYAYNSSTIFSIGSHAPFSFIDDAKHIIKPNLNGATIRQIDRVSHQHKPNKDGIYVLTSKNKLLRIKPDGTIVEITNDKIKSRGGIKQIYGNYAIDHQGGLWFYGHGDDIDPIIQDMSQRSSKPLPVVREIINNTHEYHTASIVVRSSTDNHIYSIEDWRDFSGGSPVMKIDTFDSTTLIGQQRVRLFSGMIEPSNRGFSQELNGYYDYSFVTEDAPDTVCTGLRGVADIAAGGGETNPPLETTQLVNGVLPTTCVKVPPVIIPAPAPTPTKPSPSAPEFTPKRNNLRAPNTAG